MEAFGDGINISPAGLVKGFSWAVLGTSTVVNIGGSNGFVSMAITKIYPNLSFVVQDRSEVIEAVKEGNIPREIGDRLKFMAHDFFTEQPIVADVYLFRYIFHNWPDTYAIRILRQLIPALRPGAKILINDHLLPEPNTASLMVEREIR